MPKRRKVLFIAFLALLGAFAGVAIGLGLAAAGVIHWRWLDRMRQSGERRRAASSERRVMVLGDSFLDWWPIDHFLRADLRTYASERRVALMNTAVGGFGPIEYLDQLRFYGPQFKPTLVLLFYYCGNDLTDVLYRPNDEPRRPEGHTPEVTAPRASGPVRLPIFAAAPLPMILAGAAWAASPKEGEFDWDAMLKRGVDPGLIEKAKNRVREPNGIGPDFVNPHVLELAIHAPDFLLDNLLIETERSRKGWDRVKPKLEDIFAFAARLDARVCVVAIPSTAQVDMSHREFYTKAGFKWDDRFVSSTRPQDLLAKLCREAGVDFVDLLPALKAAPDTAALYWENDDHFSEAGHLLAMKALREKYLDDWTAGRR